MSLQNRQKLKLLYQILPESAVAPASWLADEGYSTQLLNRYIKSGWLKKVSRGSYIRADSALSWQGAVYGLQHLAKLPFYVGGITSLNLQGYAHYLPLGDTQTIYLYGTQNPPAWFKGIELDQKIVVSRRPYFETVALTSLPSGIGSLEIVISSPERAILELLYQVKPDGLDFEFAAEIFEGLATLRPSLINELLLMCSNTRAKRLFLFLADYFNHSWAKYLERDKLELGTGKMQIVKNGFLDNKFLITVPKSYHAR